jgi:hypothetical protein
VACGGHAQVGELVLRDEAHDFDRHVRPVEHRVEHHNVALESHAVEPYRGERRQRRHSRLDLSFKLRKPGSARFVHHFGERERRLPFERLEKQRLAQWDGGGPRKSVIPQPRASRRDPAKSHSSHP